MDEWFGRTGEQPDTWTPVSPRLAWLRRTVLLGLVAVSALPAAGILSGRATVLGWLVGLLAVAVLGIGWVLLGRNARSWAYAERADDLLVRHGVLYRRLVVVPYGRMQLVEVSAGPLHRWFDLATVQLHTAAASTDARIPGLRPVAAAVLRDRLAARGEARSAGL